MSERVPLAISIHALLAESDSVSYVINNVIDNFYPRSPCGERLRALDGSKSSIEISIHALLAESDALQFKPPIKSHDFYPRSPCGERPITTITICIVLIFLSTLSLRRATLRLMYFWPSGRLFLSTLSLRRATRALKARKPSIHVFLSTLSLRRATVKSTPEDAKRWISIHALLAESDYLA